MLQRCIHDYIDLISVKINIYHFIILISDAQTKRLVIENSLATIIVL